MFTHSSPDDTDFIFKGSSVYGILHTSSFVWFGHSSPE